MRADGRWLGEVERCALHRANLASGDQRGVHGREPVGVEIENVAEDVAAGAGEIEVAVIRQIDRRSLACLGRVVELQGVFIGECVGDGNA